MKSISSFFVFCVVAFTAHAVSAQQSATSLTVDTVAGAFQSAGIGSETGIDDYGDPYLNLQTGGALPTDFGNVYFFDCDGAGSCDSMLMVAGYRPQRDPVYLDVINSWNVERRWVRAYIDSENYVVVDMDVSGYGGISADAVATQVNRFVSSIADFTRFIQR